MIDDPQGVAAFGVCSSPLAVITVVLDVYIGGKVESSLVFFFELACFFASSHASIQSRDFLPRVQLHLVTDNTIVIQFSHLPQHSCRRFLFFFGNGRSFSAFCSVVRHLHDAGTNTYPLLYNPFHFCRLHIRCANTHKVILCKYLSSIICTLVEDHARITFTFDTSFLRHTSIS